jgi:hypothetical protein
MDLTPHRRRNAPHGHERKRPVNIARLLRSCLSAACAAGLSPAHAAAGWAGVIVCRLPAVRRVAYRQAYAYLAGVITEYDQAKEMSGADLYDFIGQWMVTNKIPIFNITGYDGSGQPVYQQDQET